MRIFDALQPGHQFALKALVGRALSGATVPAPPLTAATEGALAAVFAQLRARREVERFDADTAECRRLILGAVGEAAGRDGPLPQPTEPGAGEWELRVEEVEACRPAPDRLRKRGRLP